MDLPQRPDQPVRAELAVVELHKVQHPGQHGSPERIRSALPGSQDVLHGFTVKRFAHLLVQPECSTHTADTVPAGPLAIVDHKTDPLVGSHKGFGDGIAAGGQRERSIHSIGIEIFLKFIDFLNFI